MMTMYQFEACPHSMIARQAMSDLQLEYMLVNVGYDRSKVKEVSGQATVPVLVDDEAGKHEVLVGEEEIVPYVLRKYANVATRRGGR